MKQFIFSLGNPNEAWFFSIFIRADINWKLDENYSLEPKFDQEVHLVYVLIEKISYKLDFPSLRHSDIPAVKQSHWSNIFS